MLQAPAQIRTLRVIGTARTRVAELGFKASTVDVHGVGVSRALFDRLPGTEEHDQYGTHEPYWSKSIGGVNVYCDEPPVPVVVGKKVLSCLELGEDSVTFEFHYPASEVGILTAGFEVGTHRYRLARMGYMLATLRGEVETLELVFEGEDGTRHILSLRTKNLSDTFVQIHEHVKAQTTPEPDTAI